jgi:hypothetical protein
MRGLKQVLLASILAVNPWMAAVPANADAIAQATEANRAVYRQQQERQIRPEHYNLNLRPVNDANEGFWRNLLWTTAIVEPQAPYVAEALTWRCRWARSFTGGIQPCMATWSQF